MTVAIMDLGTNTFHLLIVRQHKKQLTILYKTKTPVKLGENGITSGYISEKSFKRGVSVMKNFGRKIKQYNPSKIIATGTAAIRNAKNKKQFLDAIYKESGIKVKVISGIKEAKLIYEGVKHAIKPIIQRSIIMDIGGGSVEFIIADNKKIFWKYSFKLGGALLLEKFKPSDPITKTELNELTGYLQKALVPLFNAAKLHQPHALIGSSGSFDTFAEMIAWKFYSPSMLKNKTTMLFNLHEYAAIHNQLLYSSTSERKNMKGLLPMRIDMIVIASILLTFVLEKLSIKEMHLSTFALKEGVMFRALQNKNI